METHEDLVFFVCVFDSFVLCVFKRKTPQFYKGFFKKKMCPGFHDLKKKKLRFFCFENAEPTEKKISQSRNYF